MASSSECTTVQAAASAARWLTPLELTLLGAIWGGSFLFMRVAAGDFGPLALVEIRIVLGALVLLPFLWQARSHFTPVLWWRLTVIGAINSAIPFALFAWGAERAPAGIGAITNAMAVVFSLLVAVVFFGERIGTRRMIGVLVGFAGVVVLASGKTTGGISVWPAVLAGTGASLLYGIAGNLLRRHLAGVPSSALAAATLVSASILLLPLAIYTWPARPIPVMSWACSILLGVLCTGFAYVLYFRLIGRIGAPGAATVTYIVPLFGVIWAWLALDEPLTAAMAVSGALILGGVALSQKSS